MLAFSGNLTSIHERMLASMDTIIQYSSVPPDKQATLDSTTKNVQLTHTCEASIDGVDCQMPATQRYTIDTGDTRNLCDECFRKLLRMIRLYHYMRKINRGVDDVPRTSWQHESEEVA